ncbi:hypothetical protein SAMN02745220_01298 [Desulfopila aestuarii DSM 18488]|uniref:VanZ like family protein n=1 Tax=Desulfopila aestuarii DSM 18488 TaxID=1121416 RepID=A0A1M7Y2D7_9BACT|nr:hypothetical protein SAMN02745220_01298 [Desulfopila aestuarii DSM 18488]
MNPVSNFKKAALVFLSVALFALFLPGSYLQIHLRSIYHLWECGHIILFFLSSYCLLLFFPRLSRLPLFHFSFAVLVMVLILAISVEGLQGWVSGKGIEPADVVGDLAGASLFLSYTSWRRRVENILIHGIAFLLAFFVLWPALSSFADELLARYQFPLLADFETPFEISRFEGKTGSAARSGQYAYHGQYSARLSFYPYPLIKPHLLIAAKGGRRL